VKVVCSTSRYDIDYGASCAANGGAKEDHSALVRALERMANFEVGSGATEAKGKAA